MFQFVSRWLGRVASFAREESGMTLPLMGASMLVITGLTGLAVDTGRLQLVQSKLSYALDAAGLAAGALALSVVDDLGRSDGRLLRVEMGGVLPAPEVVASR